MPIRITLHQVQFGIADLPAPPNVPADERPRLLQFVDPETGFIIDVPMTAGAMQDLERQINGRQIVTAKAAPPGVDLRRGPAQGPPR